MSWILLVIAGIFEVAWAIGLKQLAAAPRVPVVLWTISSMAVSLGLLGLSMRNIPLGTAYAIWTGVGTAGSVLFGMLWFGESATALRLLCVALILCGVVGLKIVQG
jgi:quaternary ammonium compound-resistance protein SugE